MAHVEKLRQLLPALGGEIDRLWPSGADGALEIEIARVKKLIQVEGGVPKSGEAIFAQRCGGLPSHVRQGR